MKRKKNGSLNPPAPSVPPFKSVKEFEIGIFVDIDKDNPEHQKYYETMCQRPGVVQYSIADVI
jgi:hypothetical protein